LANLGQDDVHPVTNRNDRRFYHRPDFVLGSDAYGAFDGVLIGSGDRTDPRGTDTANYFYLIKDRNLQSGAVSGIPFNHEDFGRGGNSRGLTDITQDCINANACSADLSNGWKLQLEALGEKVLAPALTSFGTVFFTSYTPELSAAGSSLSCQPALGSGRIYALQLSNGAAAKNYDGSGGDHNRLSKRDRYKPLAIGGIPAGVVPFGEFVLTPDLDLEPIAGRKFWKTFWYEKNVDSF